MFPDPEPLEVEDAPEPSGVVPPLVDADDDPWYCYRCPECGHEGLDHDSWCESCGTPLNTFGYLRWLAALELYRADHDRAQAAA
jgi:hypothetical protein